MQRRGKTAAGTQRWYCVACAQSSVKQRPDNHHRVKEILFTQWLTGNATLADLAREYRVSIHTVRAWYKGFWHRSCIAISKQSARILVLDATRISHTCSLLIVLDTHTNAPLAWYPAIRESYMSWRTLLAAMPQQPTYVVSDGHFGLINAARERWPKVLVQRCMAHVLRELRKFLTLHPKLPASIALKLLVSDITSIETRRQKRRWIRRFFRWQRNYALFLKEKTRTPEGHWHYTHRNVRRARTHLVRALPDLFRYINNREVPRTSNQLEGGINSPLKDLIRKHRGMTVHRRLVLASLYLRKRAEKPPRDFH